MRNFLVPVLVVLFVTPLCALIFKEEVNNLTREVETLKKENKRLNKGVHLVWTEDDEALPPDGEYVRILQTVEDSIFLGPIEGSTWQKDEYRKAIYVQSFLAQTD